jgi:leader peptidase (prepilin peptidase)/N-methyltransferase
MLLNEWPFLVAAFALGAIVGSFLNVCIYRLPLEKSILWPGSRCGQCLQPIRWYDNIPLLSYWLLRGRCRTCMAKFSLRYFGIELLTALSFAGLYYLEVVRNVHHLDLRVLGPGRFDVGRLTIFAFHAVLYCFLLVATFCDLDRHSIPLSLTVTGTLVGLIGSVLWPWPWPYTPAEALPRSLPGQLAPWGFNRIAFEPGLYPWPVWFPLPGVLQPGGNWKTGLATGVAGVLAGTMMLRVVRFLFGFGRGPEYMEPEDLVVKESHRWIGGRVVSWFGRVGGKALGLGDADLMMMAGSFLGWQPVVVAFFVGVFPGLLFGMVQLTLRGNEPFPFGPALAMGVVMTWLGWYWVPPDFQWLFFNGHLMLALVGMCCAFILLAGYVLRMIHLTRS